MEINNFQKSQKISIFLDQASNSSISHFCIAESSISKLLISASRKCSIFEFLYYIFSAVIENTIKYCISDRPGGMREAIE